MPDCARLNGGSSCTLKSQIPFNQGSFKTVWLGEYDDGQRRGDKCVIKAFKDGSVYEEWYFDEEMKLVEATGDMVNRFNAAKVLGGHRTVRVNIPVIGTGKAGRIKGLKVLVEPFIDRFEKYNSNSGWVNPHGGEWGDAIQALSHFSYHISKGKYLLCDLQGGTYRNGL